MELYKKAYKGIFKGRYSEAWKITAYSLEDVMNEFMDYMSNNDEGMIEIQEINTETKERTVVKRILIVNDLLLEPKEDIPLKF